MDAFDADVLVYAAVPGHPLGRKVEVLLSGNGPGSGVGPAGIGSVLLLPELLTKPLRDRNEPDLMTLGGFLSRLELRPVDEATAGLATALGAAHCLRAADAIHLATAVGVGADRFLTNNAADFPKSISEITITYPDELPEP